LARVLHTPLKDADVAELNVELGGKNAAVAFRDGRTVEALNLKLSPSAATFLEVTGLAQGSWEGGTAHPDESRVARSVPVDTIASVKFVHRGGSGAAGAVLGLVGGIGIGAVAGSAGGRCPNREVSCEQQLYGGLRGAAAGALVGLLIGAAVGASFGSERVVEFEQQSAVDPSVSQSPR
jgi:hypothetical protein